ncbi:D-alanine--D-alanine ligase family protein [Geoalkalibacter halelectricus]|uniref:D-alanine--D-alanine ligase n=1 Tax=Geoalkalibacter halelectricus TaxID=2847045 RepID=A0ABY5ZNN0_9BACT|nr:ATP-grasp domain-containing protein [Geoalkalibacter halelectricus]MDO3378572.1 ATP-grasp domain-containing protein [Geoalkalibacter halelectricus]UWZ80114.1 ATP-grasp domain-containing protein [Geoalkalibacter halelectricus]
MHIALSFSLKGESPRVEDAAGEPPSEPPDSPPDDLYAEWDDIHTITAVADALRTQHRVTLVEADLNAFETYRALRPDLVFNIAEGLHGASREAQIPALLDMLDLPYTGSDPLTLGLCLDKRRTKEILTHHRVATPRFVVAASLNEIPTRFTYPAMVKPILEGSSKGVTDKALVRNRRELVRQVQWVLETYRQPALIEEFLPGREFTVALLGNGAELRVLPIVEINFDSLPAGVNPIYSYEAKWLWDQEHDPLQIFTCPAQVEPLLRRQIEELCKRAFNALGCRDWCRIDVRLDGRGLPQVIELNPLPGILPRPEQNSCFPKAARAAGLSYDQLILAVADAAALRLNLQAESGGCRESRGLL